MISIKPGIRERIIEVIEYPLTIIAGILAAIATIIFAISSFFLLITAVICGALLSPIELVLKIIIGVPLYILCGINVFETVHFCYGGFPKGFVTLWPFILLEDLFCDPLELTN